VSLSEKGSLPAQSIGISLTGTDTEVRTVKIHIALMLMVNTIPIGSMVLLYMVTWIPSIYPLYVRIYTIHGSYGIVITFDISSQNITKIEELEQIEQNPC